MTGTTCNEKNSNSNLENQSTNRSTYTSTSFDMVNALHFDRSIVTNLMFFQCLSTRLWWSFRVVRCQWLFDQARFLSAWGIQDNTHSASILDGSIFFYIILYLHGQNIAYADCRFPAEMDRDWHLSQFLPCCPLIPNILLRQSELAQILLAIFQGPAFTLISCMCLCTRLC